MNSERKEMASIILSFLDGTCGPRDWDDFISIRRRDPEEIFICDYCAFTWRLYPSEKRTEWCNDEGAAALRKLAELLASDADQNAIREFIELELERSPIKHH
jgi:hypothetical protein